MENLPMKAQGLKANKWTYIAITNPSEADNFLISKGYHQPETDLERAQLLYKYFQDSTDKELARQEIVQLHPDKAFMLHNTSPKSSFSGQEQLNCGGCKMQNFCTDAMKKLNADAGTPKAKPQMSESTMNALMIGGGLFVTAIVLVAIFRPGTQAR